MLQKDLNHSKRLCAQLGQASRSLPDLMVAGNMLRIKMHCDPRC
jgi:hypothetical protein